MINKYKNHIIDVRNVDSLPASQGGTAPTMRRSAGSHTFAAPGVFNLVAAPGAGVSIVPSLVYVQNTSASAVGVEIRQGLQVRIPALLQNQGDNVNAAYDPARESPLPAAAAMNLYADVACTVNYVVVYYLQ